MRVPTKLAGTGVAGALIASLLAAAPVAAASPGGFTCSGTPGSPEAIPAGSYTGLTMPAGSFCGVVAPGLVTVERPVSLGADSAFVVFGGGALTIDGPLTVGPGAAFGADFAVEVAPVKIEGPVRVLDGAAFFLGTEAPYAPPFATIGGPVTGLDASAVVIQNTRIEGPVRIGGGGADNPIVDAIAGAPGNNYTDLEDDVIAGSVTETGYDGIWAGVIRSVIGGPLVFADNAESTIDQYDIGSDIIEGPAYCANNDPAPNMGASNGAPSIVDGPTRGNQAATCTGVPDGITGPPPA